MKGALVLAILLMLLISSAAAMSGMEKWKEEIKSTLVSSHDERDLSYSSPMNETFMNGVERLNTDNGEVEFSSTLRLNASLSGSYTNSRPSVFL